MITLSRASWRPTASLAAWAVALACAAGLSACGGTSAAAAPPKSSAAASSAPVPRTSVALSAGQLDAIRIGRVTTHLFPVEKTELGRVAFADDPAIAQAESTLLGAAATLGLTRQELQRARLLYQTQGVSGRELEQARSDEQTAAAALVSARIALHALGQSDTRIAQLIASGKIDPPPGNRSTKWVEASVFETDIPALHAGEPARVRVSIYPGEAFTGQVRQIYATVDPNIHRQTVRCEVSDPKDLLRPGMLTSITISTGAPITAMGIPADGVVREGDGTLTAWVTTDRRHFTQQIIKAGLREAGEVQILQGLRPGEQVVTQGAIYLDNMINAAPAD